MGAGIGAHGNMQKVIIGSGQGSWNPLEAQPAVLLACPSSQTRFLTTKRTEIRLCPRCQMTSREWWRRRVQMVEIVFSSFGQQRPQYRLRKMRWTLNIKTANVKPQSKHVWTLSRIWLKDSSHPVNFWSAGYHGNIWSACSFTHFNSQTIYFTSEQITRMELLKFQSRC